MYSKTVGSQLKFESMRSGEGLLVKEHSPNVQTSLRTGQLWFIPIDECVVIHVTN